MQLQRLKTSPPWLTNTPCWSEEVVQIDELLGTFYWWFTKKKGNTLASLWNHPRCPLSISNMFTAHLEVETDAFGWTLLGLITVQLHTVLHLHFLRGDYYLPFFCFTSLSPTKHLVYKNEKNGFVLEIKCSIIWFSSQLSLKMRI